MKFNQTISVSSPLVALGSLLFNGTGIWLWGSPGEPANMSYGVVLDSTTFSFVNYLASGALFSQDGLPATSEHRMSFHPANILSSVVIEMDVDANMQLDVDDAELFSTPPLGTSVSTHGDWAANECIGSGQYAGTCHTSSAAGDWISFTFQGDAITVYGAVDSANSGYTVSIDGSAPTSYSGTVSANSSSVALALASNLGPGDHVITIANNPSNGLGRLEIDYVLLWTTLVPTDSATPQLKKSTKIALIVGTILGCAFIAISWLFVLLFKQRTAAIKAAAAKLLDSDAWSFNWNKKERDSSSVDDDESFTDEKRPATPSPAVSTPLPARLLPTHSKTTSFDAPWLESSPRQPSFHPFTDDDAPAPKRSGFVSWWRSGRS